MQILQIELRIDQMKYTYFKNWLPCLGNVLLTSTLLVNHVYAGILTDDEARKAILDLREKVEKSDEQQRTRGTELSTQLTEQGSQLKRSLLDLNSQLEVLRDDNAKLRGQNEQLARDLAEVQRQVKDLQLGVNDRVSKLEVQKVTLDGKEFTAQPEEKRHYDDGMAQLRQGQFAAAAAALQAFQKRYPASGYSQSVLFWLGNAYYGKRDYKEAIASFQALIRNDPENLRAPEAMLSIANCQLELKETKGARLTLADLIRRYPKSEAAQAGRERLGGMK